MPINPKLKNDYDECFRVVEKYTSEEVSLSIREYVAALEKELACHQPISRKPSKASKASVYSRRRVV